MYFLATLLGFISHSGESEMSIGRVAATFVPFTLAWTLVSPWLGAYDPEKLKDIKSIWRPALASLYAAPLGALGRSLVLKTPILVLFVLIMGGVTAVLIVLWRTIFSLISLRSSGEHSS